MKVKSKIFPNRKEKLVFEKTVDQGQLAQLAAVVQQELKNQKPFCLWLIGEVGAGKTTFTRFLMQAFGLPSYVPVTSPTYGFLNDYELEQGRVAHIDMYRGDGHIDEIGIDLYDDYLGFVVEWPEMGSSNSLIPPTHALAITEEPGDTRCYRLFEKLD